ncbi:hypothetical protein HYH02_010218 [Chlamydomonas schloesseri]|uniref:Uncharacterized protein n=1 Tax=Chlamydomonas schloesseri TaxID=2026947 RepID=A0A835W7Z3_9CHLO|nr:hypothetical protein HYH02_010218 [Chlamydomonas schloesseri]|eukprot:KAG2440639.1 hypothetical protein HYH02_010218 [Chlamydomonas schloesseri]
MQTPASQPADLIRSSEQLTEQQRLRQLMPPPPAPAAAPGPYRPCPASTATAAAGDANVPRPPLASCALRPLPSQHQQHQHMSATGLRYAGAPAPHGVAGYDQQQGPQLQSLSPRMQAGPAAAPVDRPHNNTMLPPRHHVSREQMAQLQLQLLAAAAGTAGFRGAPGASSR